MIKPLVSGHRSSSGAAQSPFAGIEFTSIASKGLSFIVHLPELGDFTQIARPLTGVAAVRL